MDGLASTFSEFIKLIDVWIILIMLGSTAAGVIIGALPGLSATMGIALLTGLTYKFPIVYTFTILIGIYVGAIYGGSISAILLNIPGTASAAATALEGYPLAKQGKAVQAIKVTRMASIIGTLIGVIALAILAPLLTKIALMFTSPEYFMLALFGVLICGSVVSSDLPIKGWIGGVLGLMVACIGMDKLQGASRFDFGIIDLMSGIAVVPAMIGFYAIPEVIKALSKREDVEVIDTNDGRMSLLNRLKCAYRVLIKKEAKKHPSGKGESIFRIVAKNIRIIVQSALIGVGIGALPGVGEDVAAWVAYDMAKKTSKMPEKYGTGIYEGAIAPEVGNNSAIGGALIPMLTLGVPGSPPAAVMLGALMIHNIQPGPMITRDNPTFIPYMAALLFMGVIALWVTGNILARPMSKILKVPNVYLMPIVTVLSIVGAYAINLRAFDIIVVIVFGLIGYFFDKMKYSPAPIVLGLILGNMIDENFRRSLTVSRGDVSIFIDRPISMIFLVVIILTILTKIFKRKKRVA